MELVGDPWLGERLGVAATTVAKPTEPEPPLPAELEPGFYQAKVPADRPELVAALSDRGFRIVSTNITLSRQAGCDDPQAAVDVRGGTAADAALLDIAERSFSRSRFHLDPDIPDGVANLIKRDWVGSYLGGERGERLLVAEAGGEPVGFLAVLAADGAQVIDLIAVDEPHRSSGVGTALVHRLLQDAAGEVRVGTQGANPEATRFYERLGFVTDNVAYDVHLHVR